MYFKGSLYRMFRLLSFFSVMKHAERLSHAPAIKIILIALNVRIDVCRFPFSPLPQ